MSERCPAWPASTKTRGASASQLRRADQRSVCAACITKGHDGEEQTSAQGGRCCRRDKRLGAPAFDRACPTRSRKRFCVHGPAETPPWPNLAQKNELQVLWGAGPHLIAHGPNTSQDQPAEIDRQLSAEVHKQSRASGPVCQTESFVASEDRVVLKSCIEYLEITETRLSALFHISEYSP